jgi:uncharacterized protein (DUF305 family)
VGRCGRREGGWPARETRGGRLVVSGVEYVGSSAPGYDATVSSRTARVVAVLLASAIAMCVSSCSSRDSGDHAHPAPKDQPVVTGEPAGFNADDVAFANKIIPNCKQGIDMSGLVPDRYTDPKVAALAAAGESALQSDIRISKVLLLQWSENSDNQTGTDGPGTTTKGMVDPATIATLDSSRGGKFDTLWLQSMIDLDQGAVEIANAEIANGKNVDAVGLARQIVDARRADIGHMRQILGG